MSSLGTGGGTSSSVENRGNCSNRAFSHGHAALDLSLLLVGLMESPEDKAIAASAPTATGRKKKGLNKKRHNNAQKKKATAKPTRLQYVDSVSDPVHVALS